MRSDGILQEALEQTGVPVKQYEYKGTRTEYIVFNEEDERCTAHADDGPQAVSIWWQVHLFAPETFGYRVMKRRIRLLLLKAGFTVREAVTLREEETGTIHIIISCNMMEDMEE